MTEDEGQALLVELDSADWGDVREAVEKAGDWLRTRLVDDLAARRSGAVPVAPVGPSEVGGTQGSRARGALPPA